MTDSPADDSSQETLAAALARHHIDLPEEQVAILDRYRGLLWAWNKKLNLTRHTDMEKFVSRDVVDSLAFSQFLPKGEDVLDVGTGGGVPGVILAIVRDDLSVSLCESVAKKARAVEAIVKELGLNAAVRHARAEDLFEQGDVYDTLVLRAVARMEKLLGWFNPHWGSFRRILLLKGPSWIEERRACRERQQLKGLQLRRLLSYPLPGGDAESVLLQISDATQ